MTAVHPVRERRESAGPADPQKLELKRISRFLHDEIGPLLCGMGLRISMLAAQTGLNQDPDVKADLESLQNSLDEAVRKVRAVSYRAEPETATRCGLRTALAALSEAVGRAPELKVDLRLCEDEVTRTPAAAECFFQVARDVVVLAEEEGAHGTVTIATERGQMTITTPEIEALSKDSQNVKARWSALAAQVGVLVDIVFTAAAKGTKISVRS